MRNLDPRRIVVKLPVTRAGVEAAARLADVNGVETRICLTACYASSQALIAASAGVECTQRAVPRVRCHPDASATLHDDVTFDSPARADIAPYLGRMTDAGKDGLEECARMQAIVDGMGSKTRILVASIREVDSMATLAARGLDTYTFSPETARMLFSEPLTDAAADVFEEAARGNA